MANRYYGSYRDLYPKPAQGMPRGVARATREEKRLEAERRNRLTPDWRRSNKRQPQPVTTKPKRKRRR